ncbi:MULTISPECIES: Rv3654c family TadE-like protein [unclassified Actinomyces]|uniref:Rv3654c family TadE-like protein n=1 Tax=unclassified Actinomyces TaxID=2609248 RepID=UPI00202B6360|nr:MULTISPECIES: Rv3654c family TadE-like protein [unclassified Actinomyces]
MPQATRRDPEDGSGTVTALAVIAVLLVLAVATTGLIQAQAAAGRARLAADLAALGGATAQSSLVSPGEACAVAQRVAEANGAVLTGCTVLGEDVTVRVAVSASVLGVGRTAAAAARAGPVERTG